MKSIIVSADSVLIGNEVEKMAKKKGKLRSCRECIHEYACQAWSVGHISDMDASHCVNYETVEDSNAYFLGKRKAIDEFAELIKQKSETEWVFDLEDEEQYENFLQEIDEIAESMKGEKE